MKRLLGSVMCMALAAIGSAALLRGEDEASGTAKQSPSYKYIFSQHEFESTGRTNFTLDVTLERSDCVVVAWCDLRDEQQQGVGRFLLGNVNVHDADAPLKFRINCLANAYINKSSIRAEIREKKSNKQIGVLEVALRDAVAEAANTADEAR